MTEFNAAMKLISGRIPLVPLYCLRAGAKTPHLDRIVAA